MYVSSTGNVCHFLDDLGYTIMIAFLLSEENVQINKDDFIRQRYISLLYQLFGK